MTSSSPHHTAAHQTVARRIFARRIRVPIAIMVAVLAGTLALATGPSLARADSGVPSGSTSSGTGWIRLTHLSPDTGDVNVTLTSLSDSSTVLRLAGVGYGDVSSYRRVPAGRYVAAMTPAGGNGNSKPVITQAVTVRNDYAYTVAAIGRNSDLKGLVLNDDLRSPSAGQAKIRLIQAATVAPSVTVTAMGGPVLARDAAFGSATGYAQVKAGVWTVDLTPGSGSSARPEAVKVTAKPDSVNTVVLLNGSHGQLATKVLHDAGGSLQMPAKGKGVNTGEGGTASQFVNTATRGPSTTAREGVSGLAALAALLLSVAVLGRRARAAGRGGVRGRRTP